MVLNQVGIKSAGLSILFSFFVFRYLLSILADGKVLLNSIPASTLSTRRKLDIKSTHLLPFFLYSL